MRRLFITLMACAALTANAHAQPAPMATGENWQICASLGSGSGLADIDRVSCRPLANVGDIDPQGRVVWSLSRMNVRDAAKAPLGVYTGAMAAREIWWNGEQIGSVGRVGASKAAEIAGALDSVTWIPPHLVREGGNELAIRYSSFHLPLAVRAPVHYSVVARMDDGRPNPLAGYILRVAAAGALIAGIFFFGFTFVRDRRALGALFVALMAFFAVSQLTLEMLRTLISYAYPLQIWRLIAIAAAALGLGLSMTATVAHRFTQRWRGYTAVALAGGCGLTTVMPGFDGIAWGFILAASIVSFVAAARGVVAKASGAIPTAAALFAFTAAQVINPPLFLDQTLFLAVSAVIVVLFVDQVRAQQRSREAEQRATHRATMLELELLRRRIAPHFLMNTLNALTEWVESDPKVGVKMIHALANEFRLLSQISDQPLIPLRDELALCRLHLDVMSYRVDQAFTLTTQGVDENQCVPPGVIHTLVENAFTHGRFLDGGTFILASAQTPDGLKLTLVTPPAHAAPETRDSTGGEGLTYVRRRLESAFGPGARVDSQPAGAGWETILSIPQGARAV